MELAKNKEVNNLRIGNFMFMIERFPNINYKVRSANIPGIALGELLLGSPKGYIKIPGDSLTYEDLIVTSSIDENLENYSNIYYWIQKLKTLHNIPDADIQENFDDVVKVIREDYLSDCVLMILSNNNQVIKKLKFFDCWPRDVGSIELKTGESYEPEMNITFAYNNFKFI